MELNKNITINNISISRLGFGTIPILRGNITTLPRYTNLGTKRAIHLLRKAYDYGINFFDTAVTPEYGDAENKLGEAFDSSDKVIISSKARAYTFDDMNKAINHSLVNLKRDNISIYGIHQLSPEMMETALDERKGALSALIQAKKDGKISKIGLGTHHASVAIKAQELGVFDKIQLPVNIIESGLWSRIKKIKPFKNGDLLWVAHKVLAGGGLVSHAKYEELIHFVLGEGINTALVGIGTELELDRLIEAYHKTVTSQQIITRQNELRKYYPCTRCQLCHCPKDIEIPKVLRFDAYMKLGLHRWVRERLPNIENLNCDNCGKCLDDCPESLNIPKLIYEFKKIMADIIIE